MHEEPEEIGPEEPPAAAVEEPEPAAPPEGTWRASRGTQPTLTRLARSILCIRSFCLV